MLGQDKAGPMATAPGWLDELLDVVGQYGR